ncbi:MAG: DUF3530 family protein [Gammaproteobacteria bacterium]
MLQRIFFLVCLGLPALSSAAGDAAREQRIAEQVSGAVRDAEVQWLESGGQKFLALYTPQRGSAARGGIVLLPGLGGNADSLAVINPLRRGLPEYGWTVMSIQLPVLAPDATLKAYAALYSDAAPRIAAALAALRAKGVTRIVLVGYGLGAHMAATYLAATPEAGVSGLIGIGLRVSSEDPLFDSRVALTKLLLPVLDVYGSRDVTEVTDTAAARASAARSAGNNKYQQIEIIGADSEFTGLDDSLIVRIRGWLQRHITKDVTGAPSAATGTVKPVPSASGTPASKPPAAAATPAAKPTAAP